MKEGVGERLTLLANSIDKKEGEMRNWEKKKRKKQERSSEKEEGHVPAPRRFA